MIRVLPDLLRSNDSRMQVFSCMKCLAARVLFPCDVMLRCDPVSVLLCSVPKTTLQIESIVGGSKRNRHGNQAGSM